MGRACQNTSSPGLLYLLLFLLLFLVFLLFLDTSVHTKYQMCYQAGWIVHTCCLGNITGQDDSEVGEITFFSIFLMVHTLRFYTYKIPTAATNSSAKQLTNRLFLSRRKGHKEPRGLWHIASVISTFFFLLFSVT